jgi:hypothetical protein
MFIDHALERLCACALSTSASRLNEFSVKTYSTQFLECEFSSGYRRGLECR